MAIRSDYGMGTYNPRVASVNISAPRIAGGVATPLAFFPSTSSGSVDEAIDTSLQDLIDASSGYTGGDGGTDVSNESSDRGGYSSGKTGGLGLGQAAASAGKAATSIGLGLAGAPAAVASIASGLVGHIADKGISDEDIANIAISTAMTALGVPGLAMGALSALGFNPAQGLAEMAGITNVTPGYEGGFFGTPGIGTGISGSISDVGSDSTTSGFDSGDLGGGISGPSTSTSDTPAGYGPSDLGGGISGGISTGGLTGGETTSSDSSESSDSDSSSDSKIVCTAMNATYGFGSFRNAIWLRYSASHLTKYHEIGYHAIFLPLVNRAYYCEKPNLIVRNILEHLMRHRTADLRAVMYSRKRDFLGRIYRTIFEPICYIVGFCKSKLTSLSTVSK